jgi:hypothetical protein
MPNRCVYTVLYGAYDRLPPQPAMAESALPFIAFVDPASPPAETHGWDCRPLPPRLPGDTVRSARYAKLHPHVLLPDMDESLYVDCSIRLRQPPEALFAALLDGQPHPLACLAHSHRSSVLDEVRAVLNLGYDDPEACCRQLEYYAAQGLRGTGKLIWAGMLLRRHHDATLVRFSAAWWEQILRFSRRDQIAFPFLAEREDFAVTAHAIDNEDSPFHQWPVPRDRPRAPWRQERPGAAAIGPLALVDELRARMKDEVSARAAPCPARWRWWTQWARG